MEYVIYYAFYTYFFRQHKEFLLCIFSLINVNYFLNSCFRCRILLAKCNNFAKQLNLLNFLDRALLVRLVIMQ